MVIDTQKKFIKLGIAKLYKEFYIKGVKRDGLRKVLSFYRSSNSASPASSYFKYVALSTLIKI